MTPLLLLSVCLAITLAAVLAQVLLREGRMRALARLAGENRMNYSATDHLRLGGRIASRLPIVGASDVRAFDLIYSRSGRHHRFLFTADCTVSHAGYDRRIRRVCRLIEPADDAAGASAAGPEARKSEPAEPVITVAPADMPIAEQYRHLIELDPAE